MSTIQLVRQLRIWALLEGISYLLLFGVSMPLKYLADIPEPNYVIGMAHGMLFIGYCILVFVVGLRVGWSWKTFFWSGLASLLPFGTFVADRKIFFPLASKLASDQ